MVFFWWGFMALIFIEVCVFAAVIGAIGFAGTFAAWLVSVLAGGYLVRRQGAGMLANAQGALRGGVMPAETLFQGLCLFAAGALFILPGFVSDLFAFALLFPMMRKTLRAQGNRFGWTEQPFRKPADDGVIDAVYRHVEETPEQIADQRRDA